MGLQIQASRKGGVEHWTFHKFLVQNVTIYRHLKIQSRARKRSSDAYKFEPFTVAVGEDFPLQQQTFFVAEGPGDRKYFAKKNLRTHNGTPVTADAATSAIAETLCIRYNVSRNLTPTRFGAGAGQTHSK